MWQLNFMWVSKINCLFSPKQAYRSTSEISQVSFQLNRKLHKALTEFLITETYRNHTSFEDDVNGK